jgi:hypothetical protein
MVLRHFTAELKRPGCKGKHALVLGNHNSRSREIGAIADGTIIIIIVLPSQCTHLAQMLDLGFFKASGLAGLN